MICVMNQMASLISNLLVPILGLLFAYVVTGLHDGFGPVIWVRRAVGRSRAQRDDRSRKELVERVRKLVPQAQEENTVFSILEKSSTRGGSQLKVTTTTYQYHVFVAEGGSFWIIPFFYDRKGTYQLGSPVSLTREVVRKVEISGRTGKQQTVTFVLKEEVGPDRVVMVLEPFQFRKNRAYPFDFYQEEACERALSAAESMGLFCDVPEEEQRGESRRITPVSGRWNMTAAREPLKRRFRAYFLKRFLTALVWTVFWCAAWMVGIEFFYGPGEALADQNPYLLGCLAGAGLVGILISFGFLIARLGALLTYNGTLRRSMQKYRPEVEEPYAVLEEDIRCRVMEVSDVYLGSDWIVFPGRAMCRDAVSGIYLEKLSQSYLSRKSRLRIFGGQQEMMYLDLTPEQKPEYVYSVLARMHSQARHGTWQRHQSIQSISDFQAKKAEEVSAPLGFSHWDRSPILEENQIRSEYERWILTTYCLYVAADPYCDGDFSFVGGYERTEYQQEQMIDVLKDAWDIHNRTELLDTVRHLIQTGRARRDGWQLGRAPMVLGFGYIAGMLTREELLTSSLDASLAIQQSFSSWQELFDSHMKGFEEWAKGRMIARRRATYQRLRKDPGSPMNTVPFHADVEALYREAMDRIGGKTQRPL